jgi:hypothetical protein
MGLSYYRRSKARAYQTPFWRDRITARYRAYGPPTELPELNFWSPRQMQLANVFCRLCTETLFDLAVRAARKPANIIGQFGQAAGYVDRILNILRSRCNS